MIAPRLISAILLAALGAVLVSPISAKDKHKKPKEPKKFAYSGMCDASAGVFISTNTFVAADDELNVLRVYREGNPAPIQTLELSPFLDSIKAEGEADIEGAAALGDRIYWITSHGRNANGHPRESRRRLFATQTITNSAGVQIQTAGQPYKRLLTDIIDDPGLKKFRFDRSALLAPKDKNGFNIEGLAAGPNGSLLIGLRNPVPDNKAIVIPLLNPSELIERPNSAKAKFGPPIELDLGGEGIRDFVFHSDRYYILGGSYHGGGISKLFEWDGKSPKPVFLTDFVKYKFNPEAVISVPGHPDELMLLSDDGNRKTDGLLCKHLPIEKRTFRALIYTVHNAD